MSPWLSNLLNSGICLAGLRSSTPIVCSWSIFGWWCTDGSIYPPYMIPEPLARQTADELWALILRLIGTPDREYIPDESVFDAPPIWTPAPVISPAPAPTPPPTPTPGPTLQPVPFNPLEPQPTPTPQPCDPERFNAWVGVGRLETSQGNEYDYQRQQCGQNVYRVYDSTGLTKVDPDGVRSTDCYLLDCKYVKDPDNSPYVLDIRSSLRPSRRQFYETFIDPQEDDLFRRYGIVITDLQTPAVGLEVITNERRSESYWQQWIIRYGIPNARIRVT
jgi:hypothetical protein